LTTSVIAPAGTFSSTNVPSSLVKSRSCGGPIIIIGPPPRDIEMPAWNAVTGLLEPFSTTRPLTRPPARTSITTSRAGASTLRISEMNSSSLRTIRRVGPAPRPPTVNAPSGPVTALESLAPMAVTRAFSMPAPLRVTRPVISTAGSSDVSTAGEDVGEIT
jgi:hypothetical protein